LVNVRGESVGASQIARDITARKRTEVLLRASETRYRNLFELIDEGFCVIQMAFANNRPIDHLFLEVNPAFEKYIGTIAALGRSMRAPALNQEKSWFEICCQVALTGEPMRFEYYATEMHRWYEGYAYRLGEVHERKVAMLFTDITARKQTESHLRESNEELE